MKEGTKCVKDAKTYPLKNAVQANLLQQQLRQGIVKNAAAQLDVVPQLGGLQLLVHARNGQTEAVGENAPALTGGLALAPQSLELKTRVVLDGLLDLADVGLVELGDGAVVLDAHVFDEAGLVEGERGEDFERGRSDAALVGGGVFEDDGAGFLEAELGFLGDEEVGAFDDIGDVGLAVGDELGGGGEVDALRAATAGNEHVELLLVAQVEGVAESGAVVDDLARGELDVVLLNEHAVAGAGKLGDVEVVDHLALRGEAEELAAVDAIGVDKDTGTVDDGDVLLLAEQDLVGAEIAVGTTGLQLADLSLVEAELAVDTRDVLADTESGHPVLVVRDATKLRVLTREEGLPPRRATGTGMSGSPVDKLSSVLVRSHEEDLLLAVEIDNGVLDTRAGRREEQVHDRVDVLLERNGHLVLVLVVEEDDTLAATFGDVLVLLLLGVGQVVVLVEERTGVDGVGLATPRLHDTDATTGNVSEAQVEASELGADDQEHAVQGLSVLGFREEAGVETEGKGDLGRGVEVGLQDGLVEDAESGHDHGVVLVDGVLCDQLLKLGFGQSPVNRHALVREGREEVVGVSASLHVMRVGEGKVERADQGRVLVHDLEDVVCGESLVTQTLLQLGEDLSVDSVARVKHRRKSVVLIAKSVEEVLGEDPHAVSVDGLLEGKAASNEVSLEAALRDAVKQGDLLHDLVNAGLNGRVLAVGSGCGCKVHGNDGDAVGELLDVLPGGSEAVVVVETAQGREETEGRALLETDNQTLLADALNVVHVNDGTGARDNLVHDALVDGLGVLGGLDQETLVTELLDPRLARRRVRVLERRLVDEVAANRLLGI